MTDSDQTTAWVPSKDVDGEWHLAKVVSQGEEGQVTLETLETKETHTMASDVSDTATYSRRATSVPSARNFIFFFFRLSS
jgi:hypothetical protein